MSERQRRALAAAIALMAIANLFGFVAAQQAGEATLQAQPHPLITDLKASYASDAYTRFLYDERLTPHLRSVHRIFMARAFAESGGYELAEKIMDQITTYEELPGNDPIHLRAEALQIEYREQMGLALSDPEQRREAFRPLIYYALGRIRAFPDDETKLRSARIGMRAARYNKNQNAIERFAAILEGLEP